tara:strand:+ start:3022 stop:3228 length:207 start_codon:yes stop_codon:yes gene_type:complete
MTNRGTAKNIRIHIGDETERANLNQKIREHIENHPNDKTPTLKRHSVGRIQKEIRKAHIRYKKLQRRR